LAPPPRPKWLLPAAVAIVALAAGAWLVYWQFYTPSKYLARGPGLAGLAVVPFECLTPELESSAFTRGLSESLVSDLSNLPGLQVVSPSTVRRHQNFGMSLGLMGRLLGLDAVVEGTVRKSGDRIRITPRLVDVHTGKLIWAENYDYPAVNLGEVEDQASHEIAVRIGAHLAIRNTATIPK
jgi:adenylate cyclase